MSHQGRSNADWVRRPGIGVVWWYLPLGIGIAANFFALSARAAALIWSILFVWMGTGCLLNAWRCHRLHCYIAGPIFILGALTIGLFAAGLQMFGPHLNNMVSVTLILALLSFAPELIWRKYV